MTGASRARRKDEGRPARLPCLPEQLPRPTPAAPGGMRVTPRGTQRGDTSPEREQSLASLFRMRGGPAAGI